MIIRIISTLFFIFLFTKITAQEEIYELRTYELEFFKPAEVLHDYFENALLPALNRQGIENIGVFEENGDALPKKVYLLIPYDNIQNFQNSSDALLTDQKYMDDASSYLKGSQLEVPFSRITTNLIRSSHGFPKLTKPEGEANLFELRIYASHNEDALRRKVKMFDDHEFQIFEDVGLPMVFFGANIAGDRMPCLTYLLAFKDMEAHQEAWSKFGPHPEWQRIIKLEEYANNMNEITRVFLKPLQYSKL